MTCHTKDYYYMKYVDEKHNLGMREDKRKKREVNEMQSCKLKCR